MSVLPADGGSWCSWCGRYKELAPFGGMANTMVCGNPDCPDCHPQILYREAKALVQKAAKDMGEAMRMLNDALTEEHNRINELRGDVELLKLGQTNAATGG